MKRGTDHWWEVRRYKGDGALYAHCKCGFQYNCSSHEKDEEGYWRTKIKCIYLYCPYCGARKKWYFQPEYKIEECKDIRPLPFDFAIFDKSNNLICLIEYQGRQHYNCDKNNGWNSQEHFEIIQKHDKIKFNYCLTNNIKFVRISYKENLQQRMEEIINGL